MLGFELGLVALKLHHLFGSSDILLLHRPQEKNVFDAQGLRKIAEITQKARVERNIIERESERQEVQLVDW